MALEQTARDRRLRERHDLRSHLQQQMTESSPFAKRQGLVKMNEFERSHNKGLLADLYGQYKEDYGEDPKLTNIIQA